MTVQTWRKAGSRLAMTGVAAGLVAGLGMAGGTAASASVASAHATAAAARVADLAASTASTASAAGAVSRPSTVRSVASSGGGVPTPVFGSRYYLASSTGAVWPFDGAPNYGSLAGKTLARPIVGITMTPDHHGYWLVASDGGVFSFGDARFYGSTGAVHLARPIVGMASTASGKGYWLFAGDGGVFAFGDAGFHGSTGSVRQAKPIVGMAPTSDGTGYWEVASDGGVFPFGTAHFAGALGPRVTGETVEKLVPARSGSGYWEVASDGDIYPFGSAVDESVPTVAVLHEINGPGDVAVEWAMAQLGKPYLWGGTGPNAFDCSGLVMRAWQAAGVSIPRVAADQYNFGTHVAISQLRPGDLVFWADNPAQPATIHHVAMYLGGDHMVNAPYTGQVVRTDWIGGSGFVELGARP